MTVYDLLMRRRSARSFDPSRPLDDAALERILNAAVMAPSAFNLQPWRFVVVKSEAGKQTLHPIARRQSKILDAGAVILCLGDTTCWTEVDAVAADMEAKGYFPKEAALGMVNLVEHTFRDAAHAREAVIRDVMLAVAIMMLAAEQEEVAAAPMSGFDPTELSKAFDLPQEVVPVLLLALGHSHGPQHTRPYRKQLDELVCEERFTLPLTRERVATAK